MTDDSAWREYPHQRAPLAVVYCNRTSNVNINVIYLATTSTKFTSRYLSSTDSELPVAVCALRVPHQKGQTWAQQVRGEATENSTGSSQTSANDSSKLWNDRLRWPVQNICKWLKKNMLRMNSIAKSRLYENIATFRAASRGRRAGVT